MRDISVKYSLLSTTAKKEAHDFIDFLLKKQKNSKKFSLSDYKKKILHVSSWSEKDLEVFEENKKLFNNWNIQKW